jgi:hypothetical protein
MAWKQAFGMESALVKPKEWDGLEKRGRLIFPVQEHHYRHENKIKTIG